MTYFGYNESSPDNNATAAGAWMYNHAGLATLTCPGTGKQDVKSLEALVSNASGTANFRIAIYNADPSYRSFVTQGSAEVAVNLVYPAVWTGHTAFVDQAGSPMSPQLDGGTNYWLVYCTDIGTNPVAVGLMTSGSAARKYKNSGDYTGGFPAMLDAQDGTLTGNICVRCGVEPAAVVVEMLSGIMRGMLRGENRGMAGKLG